MGNVVDDSMKGIERRHSIISIINNLLGTNNGGVCHVSSIIVYKDSLSIHANLDKIDIVVNTRNYASS